MATIISHHKAHHSILKMQATPQGVNCQKKVKLPYNGLYCALHRTAQLGSNQSCTTEQEDKYIRVSSQRNKCLAGCHLAAVLNKTRSFAGKGKGAVHILM